MIHCYRTWLKGIDGMSTPAPNQWRAVLKTGDQVWVKVPMDDVRPNTGLGVSPELPVRRMS